MLLCDKGTEFHFGTLVVLYWKYCIVRSSITSRKCAIESFLILILILVRFVFTAPDGLSPPRLVHAASRSLNVSWAAPAHSNAPGPLLYSLQMRTSPQRPVIRSDRGCSGQRHHIQQRTSLHTVVHTWKRSDKDMMNLTYICTHMHTHVHVKEWIIQYSWICHISMTDHQNNREEMSWERWGCESKRQKREKCDRIKRERGCASDMYSLHASWQQIAI